MSGDLNNHHRDTLRKILDHPASGNVEWRQVLSLLEAVGTVEEEQNGKFKVTLGAETETLTRPRGKDVDRQMVVDLRRMLTERVFRQKTLTASRPSLTSVRAPVDRRSPLTAPRSTPGAVRTASATARRGSGAASPGHPRRPA